MKKGSNNKYSPNSRNKYVKDKSEFCSEIQYGLHKKDFDFNIDKILNDDRTYMCYTNLNKESKDLYKMFFNLSIEDKGNLSGVELLVWSSEILNLLNDTFDSVFDLYESSTLCENKNVSLI